MTGKRLPDDEYNRRWVARVRARSVTDSNGCWIWQGFCGHKGYGMTSYRERRSMNLHRGMYQAFHGVLLTPDQVVCHRCDVRPCCNPDHLFLGTFDINNKDMAAKGRCKYSAEVWPRCKNGHEFTPENTYINPKYGFRHCRACQHEAHQKPEYIAWRREYQKRRRAKLKSLQSSEEV